MPNPNLTPGKASGLTAAQICAKTYRTLDDRHVTGAEKKEVYARYGIARCTAYCAGVQGCEIDHLVSLELGGSNKVENLWPQPYDGPWNAHDKDRLEQRLNALVCSGKITLKEAQNEIRTDWVAAFKKYVGARKPPKKKYSYCEAH